MCEIYAHYSKIIENKIDVYLYRHEDNPHFSLNI
jgi:hypothetical protein